MSRAITLVWKIDKPTDATLAKKIADLALRTALGSDKNVTSVLIRSFLHNTTRTINGGTKWDVLDITIATKNTAQEAAGKHRASHGYTASIEPGTSLRVEPTTFEKDDSTIVRGRTLWPGNSPKETVRVP